MRHFITFRGISNGSDLTLDVSAICNSNNTQIKKPRCTTTFQSATSSASFVVGWTPDKIADPYDGTLIDRDSLYRTCIEAMLACIETKADMNVKILDDTRLKTEFRGYIDPTEISLSRTKIPGTIAVSCKDYTTDLDKKIGLNIVRENISLNELVEELLELCFGTGQHELVGTGADGIVGTDASDTVMLGIHRALSSLPSSVIVERFVVTEEDGTTYRQAIDRLLLEKAVGYVLHYMHNVNKFEIVQCIPDEVDDSLLRTVNFMAESELVTRTGVYGHDGILLKWPTIEERPNDNVYAENIDPKFDSSFGYIGALIQNGSYYPNNGDIVKTKQEYRRSDRAYVTGEARLKNSDIDLIYAKNAELGIIATPVAMRSRGTVANLDELEALSDPQLGDYSYVSDEQVASYRAYNGSKWEYADTPSLTDGKGNVYKFKGEVDSKTGLPPSAETGDYYLCRDTKYHWCWMDAQWQRKISEFCFPVLNTSYFNMEDGNPAFYPCSMWALGRNRSGGMVNLQALSVTATSVARTKINKTTQPSIIKDAEEYEAQYITDQSSAEAFALFLYNSHRISCTTCTWYEWDGQLTPLSKLGERVRVEYMSGNSAVFCVIQIDDMAVTRLSRKYRVTAVLVSGFETSFSGNHEAAVAPTVINRREVVGQQTSYACTDSGVIIPSENEWSSQRIIEPGKYLWTRTITIYSDSMTSTSYSVVYNPSDAEIFDFYFGINSFQRNRRLSESQEISITKDIQGLTGYSLSFACYCDGVLNNSLLDSTTNATKLTIPLNNAYRVIKVVMSADPSSVHDPVEHSIGVIDQTLKDNNFGTWQPTQSGGQTYVLPDHFVADGKINSILEGDYFVAGLSFATDADDVTPLGTEDPQALGWYERHGSGTDSDPYWWEKSSDTVVDGTKTYGEAVSTATYIPGVPYIYSSGSWHNAMQATKDNSMRMLGALSAILTSGTDVPVLSALYAWFRNLTALDAILDNLYVNFLNIGSGTDSPNGGFFMHIYDSKNGNPPEILAKYNGERLWQINPETGKMYGNFAEVRQYMPYQFEDSLDDTYPMECDFYIPVNAIIVNIKLSSKGKNYRAYSKATNSAGGTISSGVINFWGPQGSGPTTAPNISATVTKIGDVNNHTSDAGGHKHSYDKTTGIGGLLGDGAHTHGLNKPTFSNAYTEYANPDNHRHGVSIPTQTGNSFGQADGAHSHTVQTTSTDTSTVADHQHSIPDDLVTGVSLTVNKLRETDLEHKHSVDISHGHNLTFGIYESTTPAGVELKCSNNGLTYGPAVSGMGTGGDVSNLDITSQFSGTGWKAIKFTSTRLGRIQAQLVIELLVTT